MALRFPRRPSPSTDPPPPGARKVAHWEAGRYIGCQACGRLLKIEWAVRSLVCSCGARVPVTLPER
ncbi:MAG TPA: hypothetical protein VGB87_06440 [Vicinamibacteria bacterium]